MPPNQFIITIFHSGVCSRLQITPLSHTQKKRFQTYKQSIGHRRQRIRVIQVQRMDSAQKS